MRTCPCAWSPRCAPNSKASNQLALLEEMEMPLVPVLAEMEMAGVRLDLPYLDHLADAIGRPTCMQSKTRSTRWWATSFNINSTQQLADVLFGKLGLRRPTDRARRPPENSPPPPMCSNPCADEHSGGRAGAAPPRTLQAALHLCGGPAAATSIPHTGRVHTSYNQCRHGHRPHLLLRSRISRTSPSAPRMGRRHPPRLHRSRRSRAGLDRLFPDRTALAAAMAQDPAMIDSLRARGGYSRGHGRGGLWRALAQVTPAMRRHAKAVNFGLLYGQSGVRPDALDRSDPGRGRGVHPQILRALSENPRLHGSHSSAWPRERGYVETLLGRRRYFPELNFRLPAGCERPQPRRTRSDQRSHPGHGRRHDQARDDPPCPGYWPRPGSRHA